MSRNYSPQSVICMPQGWVKEERNNGPDLGGHRIRWEFVGKLKKSYRHPGNKGGCAIAGANNNYFFLVINLYNDNNDNNDNNDKNMYLYLYLCLYLYLYLYPYLYLFPYLYLCLGGFL